MNERGAEPPGDRATTSPAAMVLALLGLGLAVLVGPAPQARVAGVALVAGAVALGVAALVERLGRPASEREPADGPGDEPE